jgi:hypothetical protein
MAIMRNIGYSRVIKEFSTVSEEEAKMPFPVRRPSLML